MSTRIELDPPCGQSRLALWAFGLLAAVYLMTFGPVTWKAGSWVGVWTYLAALGSTVVLGAASAGAIRFGRADSSASFLAASSGALALLIVLPAVFHWAALVAQPPDQTVNVVGLSVANWIPQHWYFAIIYLLFPILLPGLYLLLCQLPLDVAARIVAVCLALSVAVQYYQGLVDWSFFNYWIPGSGRTGGLATDPNAYQLITFMLAPLLVALALLDRRRGWGLATGLVAVLSVVGLVFAGGRTATGGLLLLLVLSPLILAVAMRQWSVFARVSLGILPFVLLIAGAVVLVGLTDEIRAAGLLGGRMADSVERLSSGGLRGLLFDQELRGFFWQIGWLLLWQSPLSGWGAGGFRREYQTEAFLQTGGIPDFVDYVGNHYLMIPIDLGIPALLIQLAIVILVLIACFRTLRRLEEPRSRLALAILLMAQFVFLLMILVAPPYFPDAIYAWTLNLAVLLVIAQRAGVPPIRHGNKSTYFGRFIPGLLAALVVLSVIGSYGVTFGSHSYRARFDAEGSPLRYEHNCYGMEQHGQRRWRWCGRNARVKLPLTSEASDEIVLTLSAGNPDLQQNPLKVRYGGLAGPTQELILATGDPATIRIPLDAEHVVELSTPDGKVEGRFAVLSLDVSRTWIPKAWGISDDSRELGIMVQVPSGLGR